MKPVDFYRAAWLWLLQEEPSLVPAPQRPSALGATDPKVLGQISSLTCVSCSSVQKPIGSGWKNPKPQIPLKNWINKFFLIFGLWNYSLILGRLHAQSWKLLISFSVSSNAGTDLWPLLSSLLNPIIYSLSLHNQSLLEFIHFYTFQNPTLLWVRFFGQLFCRNEAYMLALSARPFIP